MSYNLSDFVTFVTSVLGSNMSYTSKYPNQLALALQNNKENNYIRFVSCTNFHFLPQILHEASLTSIDDISEALCFLAH